MNELAQQVAVVTGAGRGIGQAIALQLAAAGADIAGVDLQPESCAETVAKVQALGRRAWAFGANVADAASVTAAAEQILAAAGKVDILVNNAGFTRDKYLTKMPVEDWDAVVDTILKGAYLCTKAVLPSMIEQRWGRIINISSRAHLGNPGQTNYSAAKAGLIGFTRALAMEQGKFSITANAIAPGFIETELVKSLPTYEKLREAALARNPVPRLGRPDDIANAILFLASDCAGYITGDTLHVTGGRYSS